MASGWGARVGKFSKQSRNDGKAAAWTRSTPVAAGPEVVGELPLLEEPDEEEVPELAFGPPELLAPKKSLDDDEQAAPTAISVAPTASRMALAWVMHPEPSIGRARLAERTMGARFEQAGEGRGYGPLTSLSWYPPLVPDAHAGMMVTPSVKLLRPLGEGGMGSVWVAEHLALRTQVVVKFIAEALKNSQEATERFSREAAAAAQVKSPHVVQTFDHGLTADGVPYIVMELLEGRDLGAHLAAEGPCSPALVVAIIAQLGRALDRAHERGIVHRDIKPGNIFLCDGGGGEVFVKLLDFGIAKGVDVPRIDSGTKTGAMIGSPFYMSPEQILGSKLIDHRSDLWSVGVVAYEALTGEKPFDAETMGGLAIKIHSEPLPLVTTRRAGLSPAVDAWFARACERAVEKRFSNAKEMAETFAAAVGGEMPHTIELPRSNTGSNDGPPSAVLPHAPTRLAVGATTDAGIVSIRPPVDTSRGLGGARGRLAAMIAFGVLLCLATFLGVSRFRKPDDAKNVNALTA